MQRQEKLTQKSVESLKAKERIEKRDGLIPGLSLVAHPTGRKVFVLRYRPKSGKLTKLTLGVFPVLGVAEARAAAREALIEVGHGQDPHKQKMVAKRDGADRDQFEVIFDRFLTSPGKRGERRKRTVSEWRRMVGKDVLPAWQGKSIAEITRRDVRDVLDAVVERGGGVTANRVHTALNALFHYAVRKDIITSSPMTGIDKPVAETSRDRVLTDSELRKLWRGLIKVEPPVAPFIRFLLLTGARRSEVANLVWSEINMQKAEWLLPSSRAKNRQEKLVPLSAEALAVLADVPRGSEGDHVFSYSGGKRGLTCFNAMKRKLDVAVSVKNWTLHDLRRTSSTKMHELGLEPLICEAVLGHAFVTGVAKTYNRYQYANEKRMALDSWARFVVANAEGKSADVIAYRKRG